MKMRLVRAALLVGLLCMMPRSVDAHVGDRVFPVYEVPPGYIDVTDGSAEDWGDFCPGPTLTLADFSPINIGDAPYVDPGDLTCRVFVGWSAKEQQVYFAVERIDDVYVNEYDGTGVQDIWRHDGVEMYVDGLLLCGEEECGEGSSPSVVRVDSWARIKASFR